MAKFKVKSKFKDLEANLLRYPEETVEMTVKRANEINNKLKSYGHSFLERINESKKDE